MNMQVENLPIQPSMKKQLEDLNKAALALGDTLDATALMLRASRLTKFSVVIPLYNKARHIRETLDSVIAQTHPPFEVIVVDDGSTDGGGDIAEEYFSHNVRVVRQDNKGVSEARNLGVALAAGDYVAFLDADDTWSVHFLQELDKLATENPDLPMLATGYQYKIGANDYHQPKIRFGKRSIERVLRTRRLRDYFAVASRGDLPFCASSVAIKRLFLAENGGFPTGEPMGEDQCLWSRVAIRSEIAYSPRGLSFYNLSADNRACMNAAPVEESPFSRRLVTFANSAKNLSDTERNAIIDYTAAHLLDIAERNGRSGNWTQALAILKDERCKRKPLKCLKTLVTFSGLYLSQKLGVSDRVRAYNW